MKAQNLTYQDHVKIFKRSIRLLNSLAPGVTILQWLQSFFRAMLPYVGIVMSGRIIDEILHDANPQTLTVYITLTVGVSFILLLLQQYLSKLVAQKRVRILAMQEILIANKTYALPYELAEDKETNALRKLIETHAETGVGGLFEAIWFSNNFLRYASAVVIAVALSVTLFTELPWWLNGLLALLLVASGVLITRSLNVVNHHVRKVYASVADARGLYDFYMVDYMDSDQSGKDIRIFDQAGFIGQELHERMYVPQFDARKQQIRSEGNHNVKVAGLTVILGGIAYVLVTILAWENQMSAGAIVRYYGIVTQLVAAMGSMIMALLALLNNNHSMKLLFQYLDLPEQINEGQFPMPEQPVPIEFRNVSYRYQEEGPYALRDINLRLEPGEHLAVVGKNGSGKSTLVKLLCRLYTPSEGALYLGQQEIRAIDRDAYQKAFAAVFQDFELFAFELGQNVSGQRDYDEDNVWQALELSGLKARVERFPHLLEQVIHKDFDEDGVELSGGEAQKLAIARALYKEAQFLILDEPTAALDPLSEAEIYERFHAIAGDKTTVYISHRLSSVKFCDRIVVLDRGKIIQEGTHATLLRETDGLYAELWNAQAHYYQKDRAEV